jgi:hypothetical protein
VSRSPFNRTTVSARRPAAAARHTTAQAAAENKIRFRIMNPKILQRKSVGAGHYDPAGGILFRLSGAGSAQKASAQKTSEKDHFFRPICLGEFFLTLSRCSGGDAR